LAAIAWRRLSATSFYPFLAAHDKSALSFSIGVNRSMITRGIPVSNKSLEGFNRISGSSICSHDRKGQLGLIVAQQTTGKTMLLKAVATRSPPTTPKCYLMIVLVTSVLRIVTDMERSVKAEVIASTFDDWPAEKQ